MRFAEALRLPFITASVLPFIAGSLAAKGHFRALTFSLGLIAVAATHLGANLLNDYADSKSGADWHDPKHYGFFGGSKLIQDGIFSERSYALWSGSFFALAIAAVLALAILMKSPAIICYSAAIIFFAASYSCKPLALSYRRCGEFVIFVLFGPALVMGGYYIQTGIFPEPRSFLLSLPFAFFTTAILFANEVPDQVDDTKAGKYTWVSVVGNKRAYLLYIFLIVMAYASILANVIAGILRPAALVSFIFIILAVKAAGIIKAYPLEKARLVGSSKLTVMLQGLASLILILGVVR